ncbi:hypothetical protein Avbf_03207 [Armadillidium vulgare]|nr:hypothetical protein Avbf_03207 [Armadillidium vulgare]
MESEIFDVDEDLSNDNVDDLADYIFYSYSSEDEEELYGSNNSKDKESQKINALEDCNLEQKVEKSLTDKQLPPLETLKEKKLDSTESTFIDSEEVNLGEHQPVSYSVSKESKVPFLDISKCSLQKDTNNFSLGSVEVKRTEHHDVSQDSLVSTKVSDTECHAESKKLLEKTDISNLEVIEQSLEIDSNNSSSALVELASGKASDFIHKIGKLTSTIKTVSNSVTEERKSNDFESISLAVSPDRHKSNDKYTETLKNQSLGDRKRDRRVYGPIIFIANSEIKKYLQSVEEFKSYSFWDLEYPINWVQVEENILDLSTGQSYLFIIAEDITLVTCDSPMTECFNETCKEPIIVHKLDSSKSVLTERLCFDIRNIGGLSSHSSLHTDVDNKLRPCFIDGNIDYVNAKALELKGMWFNIVQSLNCAKDLTKKLSDEMFFFLRSYNLVKWIFDSVIRFPCRFQSLWAEKLVIVIDYYIQTYLNGSKSIKIGKMDTKSLNFDSNSEGNNVSDRYNVVISAQKKIEYSNLSNLSSSNQNKEVLEGEKNESDCEELFISEELEREILGADDDEFEELAAENKTLNDNYDGGVCDLVTASKNANLTTMAEDLNYDQKVCTCGNKIVEVILNTNLMNTNANLQEKGNIYEFDMVEIQPVLFWRNVEEKDDNVLGEKENDVTKEKNNLFGEFDDSENNSCENISEENENFKFSAMKKTFDKKETSVIGRQLIQSRESFHKNLLQPIGDKSSNLSEVTIIKDYTKTKDSASPSCIKYGNENQTENSIAATNSDISVECGINEKYKSKNVSCAVTKNSLDMICDYVDDNFEKEYAQPVSEIKDKNKVEKHEDKIKAESKNDNVLSYIKSEYKLLDVAANPCYVKEEILDDDIDLNHCNFKSENNKLDLRNPNHEFNSIKEDSKGSVNMNINIDQVQEKTSENKDHIDVSEDPSYLSNDVEVKNLINEDKILSDSREKDTVEENIVDEVIDKDANKFINKKDVSEKLKRTTTQETLCLIRKQESACNEEKKTLFDNDVSEVGDEEKEKTVKDPVLKTIAGHCIAKTDTNESKEIQIPDYDVLSVPYTIRDCKVKSDSLIGENFEQKLNNKANNIMNNVTERLSNSSSPFSNSVDPAVEHSRIEIESESYSRNANLIYITAKSNVEYKATVEHSSKSEIETKVENRQDHKFNVLNV